MRRLLCTVIALFAISAPFAIPVMASSSTDTASTTTAQKDLFAVREAVWRAWFADDTKALERLVPAETIAISSGEQKWQDQAEIFQGAAQFHAAGGKLIRLEFPRTEIQHFGDVAILYSQYLYEIEMDGKRSLTSGRATETFVLRNGQWTNPGWHTDAEKFQ